MANTMDMRMRLLDEVFVDRIISITIWRQIFSFFSPDYSYSPAGCSEKLIQSSTAQLVCQGMFVGWRETFCAFPNFVVHICT